MHRLYVRFFDVGWDERVGRAAPIGTIRFRDTSFRAFVVAPVVFITNETLLHLDTAAVGPLAAHIGGLVSKVQEQNGLSPAGELQLDCDWTVTTRERYFLLLRDIRRWLDDHQQQRCLLSATIRLYPCKYRSAMGVPPVDKGLLMCYNMGDLKDPAARNSILETAELEKYTASLAGYPLPLDVALPIFDWKVLFHRDRYAGLVESLPASSLRNSAVGFKENTYTFIRDTILDRYAFAAGDRLRDEQSELSVIQATAAVVARRLKAPPENVVLFHLDSANLAKYSIHELETVFDRFY